MTDTQKVHAALSQLKRSRSRLSVFSIAALAVFLSAHSADAARVIDGDTIEIDEVTYRLNGIDAPEHGQQCNLPSHKTWPCGKRATEALNEMVEGGEVKCEGSETDGYGRTIAICYIGEVDLNREMVASGLAWAFVRYSTAYAGEEASAKTKRLGIWQASSEPAWEYRAARWNSAQQIAPDGCPIKGNISKNGHIYHAPWSPWYSRTRVNIQKGERWFCNEAEAISAGWRAPYWGR